MIPIDEVPATMETASEAIRAVNHATRSEDLDFVQTYAAVGHLVELISRLPQTLTQTVRGVTNDPAIQSDSGEPEIDVAGIGSHLTAAVAALEQVGRHLGDIHNHTGRLHL